MTHINKTTAARWTSPQSSIHNPQSFYQHGAKSFLLVCAALCATLFSMQIYASGFQSFEQNASGLGEAYSGAAAKATDPSVEFDNPAGMVRIKNAALSISTAAIDAHTKFIGTKATGSAAGFNYYTNTTQETSHPLSWDFMPAIHYVHPFMRDFAFGLGVTVPYGLESDYSDRAMARYIATRSKIETININPSIAYSVDSHWSFGIGLDAQYFSAELDQQIDAGLILHPDAWAGDITRDGTVKNTVNDWGFGWNAGVLYQIDDATRLGLSYRSSIHHKPSGQSRFSWSPALNIAEIQTLQQVHDLVNGRASSDMTVPEMVIFSAYHDFTQRWSGMASVTYTHWRRFKDLAMHFHNGMSDAIVHEDFHDTFKYAVGANYRVCSKLLLRAGLAYDQSPVDNKNRTVPLPDADRQWATFGLQYNVTPKCSVDLGYAYVHINNGRVHEVSSVKEDMGIASHSIDGKFQRTYVHLMGVQVNWELG